MAWLTENWFWLLVLIAFVAMHMFGHGGHGGHRRSVRQENEDVGGAGPVHGARSDSGGHQH